MAAGATTNPPEGADDDEVRSLIRGEGSVANSFVFPCCHFPWEKEEDGREEAAGEEEEQEETHAQNVRTGQCHSPLGLTLHHGVKMIMTMVVMMMMTMTMMMMIVETMPMGDDRRCKLKRAIY